MPSDTEALSSLEPVLRRVVAARVRDRGAAEDIVQEALTRVWARREQLDDDALLPYAVVTARNLVISRARSEERHRRHQHRLLDLSTPEQP